MLSRSRNILFALLATVASAAGAAIFDVDDRRVISRDAGSAYSPIGIVSSGPRRATGFLVSDCHVLTVKHVFSEVREPRGRRFGFRAVMAPGAPFSRGTAVAAGDSRADLRTSAGRSGDWMLLQLDTCLGRSLGHVLVAERPPMFRSTAASGYSELRSAGYPRHRRAGLVLDPSCAIRGYRAAEWLHDCAALPGNSGSPIFREVRSQAKARLEVFAMVSAGHLWKMPVPYDHDYSNTAIPLTLILQTICSEAQYEPCRLVDTGALRLDEASRIKQGPEEARKRVPRSYDRSRNGQKPVPAVRLP